MASGQCPERESNPHATWAGDFKSPVYTVPPPGRGKLSIRLQAESDDTNRVTTGNEVFELDRNLLPGTVLLLIERTTWVQQH